MRKTSDSGDRTPRSADSGVAVRSARGRAGRGPDCGAGSEMPSARAGISRGLRLVVLLAAALAVGVVRPGGMTLAMDSSNPQKKVFLPEKVYPGVKLRGSEVKQDNDWNSRAPSGGSGRPSAPEPTAVRPRSAPVARPLTTAPLVFLGTAEDTGARPDPTRAPASAGPAMRPGPVQVLTPALSFLGTGPGAVTAPSSTVHRKSIQTEQLNFIGPPPPARP